LIFSLATLYGILPSAVEEIPIAKILQLMREFEKKISELKGGFFG